MLYNVFRYVISKDGIKVEVLAQGVGQEEADKLVNEPDEPPKSGEKIAAPKADDAKRG